MKGFPQNDQRRRPTCRGGFTLLEVLAIMWGMGILTVLGVAVLVGVFKVHQLTAATYLHLNQHETLVDQFRADVAQAVSAPATLEKWTAGPACLVLRNPAGAHVVYVQVDEEWKRIRGPKGETNSLHPGPKGTQVEFARSGPDGRLVTMRLTPPQPPVGKKPRALEISAALGGDVR
jgi:type II secretory pathway pseudopilin PulG